MPKISIFPEGYLSKKTGKLSPATNPSESLEFESYIERVRDGYWQDYVLPIRAGKMEKLKAPGVTASGIFSYRNVKGMVEHSGILAVDIDAKDNPEGIDFDVLGADKYTYALHRSIGGSGAVGRCPGPLNSIIRSYKRSNINFTPSDRRVKDFRILAIIEIEI